MHSAYPHPHGQQGARHFAPPPVPRGSTAEPPWGLLRAARGEAYGMLWAAVAAIPVGVLITVLGGFFVIGLILGPLLVIGGLVMVPFALFRISDPTGHEDIARLGRTPNERRWVLSQIEHAIFAPDAWVVPLGPGVNGPVLRTSRDWIVLRGGSVLRIVSKQDALWFYGLERRRRRFGITYSSSYTLCIKARGRASTVELPMERHQASWLLPQLQHVVPHALFGYSPQLEHLPTPQLMAEVDRRRWALAASGAAA